MNFSIMVFFNLFLFSLMLTSTTVFTNSIDFYKLSIQWGRSTCSNGQTRCPTPLPPSVDKKFTIHGLWPQDAMDDPIDPYTVTHPCIPTAPTPSTQLQNLLGPLRPNLDTEWPDLKNPLDHNANLQFWEREWNKHGTFGRAYPILNLAPEKKYKVQDVIKLVKRLTGGKPEIACNVNRTTKLVQLWEIRLRYHKPDPQGLVHLIRDCPFQLSHNSGGRAKAPCRNMNQKIIVP
ncbi:hypothetical protein HRI_000197300 [Hibiscus trionum]|uniref:Uncharacterized protein n=1 Tax=Hibiscus trionum TaxID=183268 RepID=A0A9W7GTD0_HIBTR|nr:hypothetical protein HRI_000197300 [Hibiscus trionum]